ncbi:MAG: hypothetical protein ITG00_05020 [Flavobacterium sp.]|nr:hypothetical protein [Flavobacterium sp.]
MYTTINSLHSGWAYVAIFVLLIAVINAIGGMSAKKPFSSRDRIISLLALVFIHIQFVFGLILYFVSPMGLAVLGEMKDAELRLTSLEHPLVNLIAITLITIGWSKHKKLTDGTRKFKTFAIFYGLGLILLLSRIPWDRWFE